MIHDFGKILHKWGNDEDGTSIGTQFSLVGDTFIVGCAYPETLVYPEFNNLVKNEFDSLGVYSPKCGLDNCLVSYGHDEYLYQVLKLSGTKLPPPALQIIRYHSLYAWHREDSYSQLESEEDIMAKGWVKLFYTLNEISGERRCCKTVL